MNKKTILAILPLAALLAACSMPPSQADVEKATADMMKNSFQAKGKRKRLERLPRLAPPPGDPATMSLQPSALISTQQAASVLICSPTSAVTSLNFQLPRLR